jgi:3-oxoacyl-[acyl-carrier protein] reductase
VTINSLLPGSFDTDRLRGLSRAEAEAAGRPLEEILSRDRAAIPAARFGAPEELGAACAFLCSTHAGYITGQNLVLDGGAYPGTF